MQQMNEIHTILAIVKEQFHPESEDIQRVFHGRGYCYPGLEFLTIDYFSRVLFVVIYKQVTDDWMSCLIRALIELFCDLDRRCIKSVYLQKRFPAGKKASASNIECYYGQKETITNVHENGLCFQVNLSARQNIGFFPDMLEGRKWLSVEARDKRVLNLFAYTCSLSVAAMAYGAYSVTNVDMAKNTLQTGRINHRINKQKQDKVNFLAHDIFKSWSKLKILSPFDLVIIDPPSFQPGSFEAEKDYHKIIKRLPQLVSSGAKIMACVNSPYLDADYLKGLFQQNLPGYRFQYQLKQAKQSPECCRGAGLKILIYQAPCD